MSILELLIHVVHLPYEAVKKMNEESVVGQSECDQKAMRFWKWFAWIATGLMVAIPIAIGVIWLLAEMIGRLGSISGYSSLFTGLFLGE